MEDDEACNTRLSLGLGIKGYLPIKRNRKELDLAFGLCPRGEAINVNHHHLHHKEEEFISLKRIDKEQYQYPDEKIDENSCRKKLRLTKEQSAMLEDCFKLHSSLNPIQKQALAQQLNLKPRQIEVWFQNRRARTKLKQTETDCEFLKKCCESLTDENRRLKKELQELRSMRVGASSTTSPLYIQLSKVATQLAMCSSCEKLVQANEEGIQKQEPYI